MGKRRRRARRERDRREHGEAPRREPEPTPNAKTAKHLRAEYDRQRLRLVRRRTIVGALGFVPLVGALLCGVGGPLDVFCLVPREWWLLIWAALFGSFLGLTIRLVLERRKFERAAAAERPA